jgi:hypothetical protein
MIFRKEHIHTGEKEFKAVKAAKRGNEIYAWKLRKRFEPLMELPSVWYFNPRDRSSRHACGALFITLTLARGIRLDQAWEGIGSAYNKWISKLRRRYGRIEALRVFEAHKDGWPHIHAILLFESKTFDAFFYNGSWRVQEKHDLEWDEGFTDVEALGSLRGGVRYVTKYLAKLHGVHLAGGIGTPEGNMGGLVASANPLTLAMMWAFKRRAFGISRRLLDLTYVSMTNSNLGPLGQVDLDLVSVWKWDLIGFWGGDLGRWSRVLTVSDVHKMQRSGTWTENVRR